MNTALEARNPKAHPMAYEPQPVSAIAMHACPDLDSIAARFLLQKYGRTAFPGIENAKTVFWGSNGTPDSKPAKSWLAERQTLAVDTGHGIFDEHIVGGTGRMVNNCATELVAEFLGISENAELEMLLRYVNVSDNKTGTHPLHIASLVKAMYAEGKDPQEVIKWATAALEAFHAGQVRFHGVVRKEYFENGKLYPATGSGGEKLMIAVVASDNREMNRFARHEGADVLVQRNSAGQTAIFTTPGIRLARVAQLLRYEELKAKGKAPNGANLSGPNTLPEVPEWHLFPGQDNDMLFNGNPTHPGVPKTKLSPEKVLQLLIEGLKPRSR